MDEKLASIAGVRGVNDDFNQDEDRSHHTCGNWARDKLEALINFGEEVESCSTHGFEINIVLIIFYICGKCPIKIIHRWKVSVATKATKGLYIACPNINSRECFYTNE